jgi:carbonic anhydrase
VSRTDEFVRRAEEHAAGFEGGDLAAAPARKVAIVSCMDARINLFDLLGLKTGDAHLIRNAGGVVTDDVIRSLTISQSKLGTEAIVLIHHTQCGLMSFTDDELRAELEQETGIRPPWSAEAFEDVDDEVRQSLARVRHSPFIRHKGDVRGFVYEVETGRLREVT